MLRVNLALQLCCSVLLAGTCLDAWKEFHPSFPGSAGILVRIPKEARRELSHLRVAGLLGIDVCLIGEGRDRSRNPERALAVGHGPARHCLDRADLTAGIADPETGHPVGFRPRPRYQDVGVLERYRQPRSVAGARDVVV